MVDMWTNDCEGTDGVHLTAANSDFTEVVPSGSSVAEFNAAGAHVGATCIKYESSGLVTHKSPTWSAEGTVFWDGYIHFSTAPTANTALAQFFDQQGAFAAELRYQQSAGTVALRDSTYTLRVEADLEPGYNRVVAKVDPSAGAGAGLEIYVYSGVNVDTDTVSDSGTAAGGTAWGSATGITEVDSGILSAPGTTAVIYYDDIVVSDTQRTFSPSEGTSGRPAFYTKTADGWY